MVKSQADYRTSQKIYLDSAFLCTSFDISMRIHLNFEQWYHHAGKGSLKWMFKDCISDAMKGMRKKINP